MYPLYSAFFKIILTFMITKCISIGTKYFTGEMCVLPNVFLGFLSQVDSYYYELYLGLTLSWHNASNKEKWDGCGL